jgi:hypothetical protein
MKLDESFRTKQRNRFITQWVNIKAINMNKDLYKYQRARSIRNRKVISKITKAQIEAIEREYYDRFNSELSSWVGEMY